MVLTYDAYNETVEQKQEKDKQIEVLMGKQDRFEQMLQSLIDSNAERIVRKQRNKIMLIDRKLKSK
jgi:hypothetical protein